MKKSITLTREEFNEEFSKVAPLSSPLHIKLQIQLFNIDRETVLSDLRKKKKNLMSQLTVTERNIRYFESGGDSYDNCPG